jgi:hypothetical protein
VTASTFFFGSRRLGRSEPNDLASCVGARLKLDASHRSISAEDVELVVIEGESFRTVRPARILFFEVRELVRPAVAEALEGAARVLRADPAHRTCRARDIGDLDDRLRIHRTMHANERAVGDGTRLGAVQHDSGRMLDAHVDGLAHEARARIVLRRCRGKAAHRDIGRHRSSRGAAGSDHGDSADPDPSHRQNVAQKGCAPLPARPVR